MQVPPPPVPSAKLAKPNLLYFDAEPPVISGDQTTSLRWSVQNAENLEIGPDLGQVSPDGHRTISPGKTTTYQLKASNAGGVVEASVTVTVSRPMVAAASEAQQSETRLKVVNSQLKDVHFDYNGNGLPPEEAPTLHEDATLLNDLFRMDPKANVAVEGYCDERGSDEYNMALGDRRARTVKDALVGLGVSEARLITISFGKERSLCTDTTEECYTRNRRVHFSAGRDEKPDEGARLP